MRPRSSSASAGIWRSCRGFGRSPRSWRTPAPELLCRDPEAPDGAHLDVDRLPAVAPVPCQHNAALAGIDVRVRVAAEGAEHRVLIVGMPHELPEALPCLGGKPVADADLVPRFARVR